MAANRRRAAEGGRHARRVCAARSCVILILFERRVTVLLGRLRYVSSTGGRDRAGGIMAIL